MIQTRWSDQPGSLYADDVSGWIDSMGDPERSARHGDALITILPSLQFLYPLKRKAPSCVEGESAA